MTPEQKFYQWFRNQLPKDVDCVRVENTLEGGTPDVNICQGMKHFWIEMKCFVNGRTLIRPDQFAWGMRRAKAGGKVVILSQAEDKTICAWTFPDIEVIPFGKYLHVTTVNPRMRIFRDGGLLLNFLFT